MYRRTRLAVAVAISLFAGASVAFAAVARIDAAADVDRTARRVNPTFEPDRTGEERAAFDLLEIVNLERNRRGLPIYAWNDQVAASAVAHSQDMAARRKMVHFGVDGSDTGDRLDRVGFVWQAWDENIGAGFLEPQSLFDAWLVSDIHRPHLLGDKRFVGIGVAATPDGVPYWTLVVAS